MSEDTDPEAAIRAKLIAQMQANGRPADLVGTAHHHLAGWTEAECLWSATKDELMDRRAGLMAEDPTPAITAGCGRSPHERTGVTAHSRRDERTETCLDDRHTGSEATAAESHRPA
jgi:hypothetical protein